MEKIKKRNLRSHINKGLEIPRDYENEKEKIRELRKTGHSYKQIAALMALSENTIKSFCRRNSLGGISSKNMEQNTKQTDDLPKCPSCGMPLVKIPGKKAKKFCSDVCRNRWWNSHLDQVNRKANYEITCLHCGRAFISYGNKNKKYCCHACYVAHRFGGN